MQEKLENSIALFVFLKICYELFRDLRRATAFSQSLSNGQIISLLLHQHRLHPSWAVKTSPS